MKRNLSLITVLIVLIFIVIAGAVVETKHDIYNGTAVHIIIGPFAPLIIGTLVIFLRMGFCKTFITSWLITGASYYALLNLAIWHYSSSMAAGMDCFWGYPICHLIGYSSYNKLKLSQCEVVKTLHVSNENREIHEKIAVRTVCHQYDTVYTFAVR